MSLCVPGSTVCIILAVSILEVALHLARQTAPWAWRSCAPSLPVECEFLCTANHTMAGLCEGYDAMLRHFELASPAMAELLRTNSRCLPDATNGAGEPISPDLANTLSRMYPGEPLPLTCLGAAAREHGAEAACDISLQC